jgi:hypothetical protein
LIKASESSFLKNPVTSSDLQLSFGTVYRFLPSVKSDSSLLVPWVPRFLMWGAISLRYVEYFWRTAFLLLTI